MGNRAVIAFNDKPDSVGIYLHWNGGRDSVQGFLTAAKKAGIDGRAGDESYQIARLAQLIGNFFGGITSIGVDVISRLDADNGDNGLYLIDGKLDIVERKYFDGSEQASHNPAEFTNKVIERNQVFFEKR